jgi:phosphate transport system substrate-binding protein
VCVAEEVAAATIARSMDDQLLLQRVVLVLLGRTRISNRTQRVFSSRVSSGVQSNSRPTKKKEREMLQTRFALLSLGVLTTAAYAQPFEFQGSDTLGPVIDQAIPAAGLDGQLRYLGGGSGLGEAALANGRQGIAPMSRLFSPAALQIAADHGITPELHVVALDGVVIVVNSANTMTLMSFQQIRDIFECRTTDWSQVPESGLTGPIAVYRRNDVSGTTDTIKSIVGFTPGDCTIVVNPPPDASIQIREFTSTQVNAIAYVGLVGVDPGGRNQALGISSSGDPGTFFLPTVTTICSRDYPINRTLQIYRATGDGAFVRDAEQALVNFMDDPASRDPIIIQNEFIALSQCP